MTYGATGTSLIEGFQVPSDAERVIGPWIVEKAHRNGDKAAVEIGGRTKTYREIEADSRRLAAGLQALDIEAGEHASLMMVNSLENVDAWFAMCRAGIIEVPINHANRGYLLQYIIDQSDSVAIIVDEEFLERITDIADDLPKVRHVIVKHSTDGPLDPTLPATVAVHNLVDVYSDAGFVEPELDAADTSVILYTSGTTGPSKGVLLSHEANLNLARHCVWLMSYVETDVLYTVFPLFHINAKYTSVMAAMEANATLIMDTRFSASTFWDTVRDKGITAFNYQGALLLMLWKQPERADDSENTVRVAFGAPCPVDIWRPFEERFGLHLVEVYGMTEIAIATENRHGETKVGTAGRESANFHVRVLDADDEVCPPGVPGEICVRPKKPNVLFKGYYEQEDYTIEAFRNLWFHTGDRGVTDDDGYITFIDRMKDCIRRRGENISSFEVEKVVDTHDAVLESAAYGVSSELSEEEVMVSVVRQPSTEVSPEELLDHCQSRMAHFAVPRYVRFVDALPKTPSQRIQKYKLREEGITSDTWDRESTGYEVQR